MGIELRLDNNTTYIIGRLESQIYQGLKKQLGYRPENAVFMMRQVAEKNQMKNQSWGNEWDGYISTVCWSAANCKCAIRKQGTHFPSGLASKAIKYLRSVGVEVMVTDCRRAVSKTLELEMSEDFEPRDYQQEVIESACSVDRGIIKVATGGGKTALSSAIMANRGVSPMIFYVTSIDLLRQAKDELERFIKSNGLDIEVGELSGLKKDIKDITVMTVQTAVRSLGGVWKKFDDEDSTKKEKEDISKIKKEVKKLIQSAKLIMCDEVQHWASETCQIISDNSFEARYRYALSATPFRDQGDDILIDSCFGRVIADVSASKLINLKYLVRPKIMFIPIDNLKVSKKLSYANIYKECIVYNSIRNNIIATLSQNMANDGRSVLILCKQIAHGKLLEKLIPDSKFLHGTHSAKKRKAHLDLMRSGDANITIASSLPYEELLFIKQKDIIKQIKIGDLCNNYIDEVKKGEIFTACSIDGKNVNWGKITDTHKHNRENNIVHVRTNKNEDICVTENHSLVDSDLNQILPGVEAKACVPRGNLRNKRSICNIDLIDLFRDIEDSSLEIGIKDLTQGRIRTLKKHLRYLEDSNNVCKSSRLKFEKQMREYDKESYKNALISLFKYFKYYKKRYRAKLSEVLEYKNLLIFFKLEIFIRRSRKNISLPALFPITPSMAIISGLICGDGHIKKHKCGKSIFVNCFTAMKDMSLSVEGRHDVNKKKIRKIFIKHFKKVFPDVVLEKNDKSIRFNGKLLYYLFSKLGHIDKNGNKTVPYYIYNTKHKVQEQFLYGLYLSDGSKKYNTKENREKDQYGAITITNTSRPLVSGLCFLLRSMNIDYYLGFQKRRKIKFKNTYYVNICSDFAGMFLSRKVSKINMDDVERFQKEVIKTERNDKYVYDISVDGCHNFIAGFGGVLAHNTIFDEGVDCRPLDGLILAGSGKSPTRALQRVGRVLRPYVYPNGRVKEQAMVVDFMDNCKYMDKHSKKRLKIYQSEPEFDVEVM